MMGCWSSGVYCWLKLFPKKELHQDPGIQGSRAPELQSFGSPHPPPPPPASSLIRVIVLQKSTSVFQGVWLLPSVQSVEQQQDGADADHRAQDERVPSFPQVDSLDEIVDGGEPVSERRVREHIWTSDGQKNEQWMVLDNPPNSTHTRDKGYSPECWLCSEWTWACPAGMSCSPWLPWQC